VLQKLERTNTL